ncbi:hypothetical protein BTS2_0438 [Bacillus sp. TS-2]|nr:hypothetical protein BTS2_0438 [Bacillus sp. TS-2]
MRKYLKWILSITACLVLYVMFMSFFYNPHEIKINVKNETHETIMGLSITYTNVESPIELPAILAGESHSFIIDIMESSNEQFHEGSMELHYHEKFEKTIIGYFGKGYHGKVDIIIEEIDSNGQLSIESSTTVR